MHSFVDGLARFKSDVFPRQRSLYQRLVKEGQKPKALVISCSDSRVMPEVITQSDPGEMFVTRNAGNVVPTYNGSLADAVTSAIEYAVVGLKVSDIVVCGHSDCGAMKALLNPDSLKEMPNVASWLGHCRCAQSVFRRAHDGKLSDREAARLMAMENVVAQLTNLRTHPAVAARIATGDLTLHGWFFDLDAGTIFALDGATKAFSPIDTGSNLPVALPGVRRAVEHTPQLVAAE